MCVSYSRVGQNFANAALPLSESLADAESSLRGRDDIDPRLRLAIWALSPLGGRLPNERCDSRRLVSAAPGSRTSLSAMERCENMNHGAKPGVSLLGGLVPLPLPTGREGTVGAKNCTHKQTAPLSATSKGMTRAKKASGSTTCGANRTRCVRFESESPEPALSPHTGLARAGRGEEFRGDGEDLAPGVLVVSSAIVHIGTAALNFTTSGSYTLKLAALWSML
mmetsp:Transcript_4586/g.13811  ORF Transcript_4586/g.13811 Transcript_4586/m.13811 type:complete len:223 (+) Transcript_4586:318-986(+)